MKKKVNTGIDERHLREASFHDEKVQKKPKDSFYEQGAAWFAFEKMLKLAGDLHNKKVLDLGCGTGWASITYAEKGAIVTGLDISDESIKISIENARQKGLEDKIKFIKGFAEDFMFEDEFDLILGIGILHHIDLDIASHTIHKALKKGGKALFLEPLDHNPLIKLFRIITPWRRSKDEKPLCIKDVLDLSCSFKEVKYHGYNLISLLSFIFIPLKAYGLFRYSIKILDKVDKWLFSLMPFVQRYCWGAVVELKK